MQLIGGGEMQLTSVNSTNGENEGESEWRRFKISVYKLKNKYS